MGTPYICKQSIIINVAPSRVWEALVTPALIKQYLFGTEVQTDWKVGSPITYTGVWEGETYLDKGTITEIVPGKLLMTTYWSSMSNQPDEPQNYKNIIYEVKSDHGKTLLTVTQDNNGSEEEKNHSEQNWKMVLESLKNLLEKGK
jgi:uncharacterized protein YndB with AHSA1/START domain